MTDKTCPFKQGFAFDTRLHAINVIADEKKCNGERCQIWINVVQGRIMGDGKMKIADPDYEYHYEGCGLVQSIPWNLVKKEKEGDKKNGVP